MGKETEGTKEKEMTPQEMLAKFNETQAAIKEKQTELDKISKDNKDEADKLRGELSNLKSELVSFSDINEKLLKRIEKMGIEVVGAQQRGPKTIKQIVEEGVKKSADGIQKMFQKDGNLKGVTIALKGIVEISDVANSTISQMEPGIAKKPVRRVFLEELFTKKPMTGNNRGTITYTEQNTLTRNADQVLRCALIPESDITWIEKSMKINKTGDSIKICRDALEDLPMLEAEIREFLRENVALKFDEQLLLGTGVDPDLTGVDVVAPDWAAGSFALTVDDATIYDVLEVGTTIVKNAGQNNMFNPSWILMNPNDAQAMLLEKDADGKRLFPRGTNLSEIRIGGAGIIENPLVPQNEAYIGDFSKGSIYVSRDLILELFDENEDDARHDLLFLKATKRAALLIKTVHAGAFLHIPSISQAKTDLETV